MRNQARPHLVVVLVVLVLTGSLCVVACGDKRDASTVTAAKTDQPTVVVGAPIPLQPTAAAPEPPKPIVESSVRRVLEQWLAAQNSGDFSAYSALYAERFAGIKRIGQRSQRYDYTGWLRDRKRMFAKPMQVEASEVTIQTTCCTASVRFVQSYHAGSFSDRGPKELRLVPEKAGLQIVGEEMLASNVERAGAALDFEPNALRQVVHTKHTYVVLGSAGRAEDGEGAPGLDSELKTSAVVATRMALRRDAASAEASAARGSAVVLYGDAGIACRAKLGELSLLRRVVPHFGTLQMWNGMDLDSGEQHAPLPPAELAKAAWEEASERTLLVAALTDLQGDCNTALWARAADQPEPVVFVPKPVSSELTARVLSAVHALPTYRAFAKQYETYKREDPELKNDDKPWELYDDAQPRLVRWQNGARQLVSFEADVGACSSFGAALWVLYELNGEKLELKSDPASKVAPGAFSIQSVLDVNADGQLDLLGGDSWRNTPHEAGAVLRGSASGHELVREIYAPYHDCGC